MVRKLTFLYILFLLALLFSVDFGFHEKIYQVVGLVPMGDKIGHFLFMGTLAFGVSLSIKKKYLNIFGKKFLKGSIIVFAIVTLEELSQGLLPHRTLSWQDWMADTLGILLGSFLALRQLEKLSHSDSSHNPNS
ncbi:MAG: VanZ family protein [Bacteroidia bacterium]|nr:VanZ family protein [Bacteroidia bacterium]